MTRLPHRCFWFACLACFSATSAWAGNLTLTAANLVWDRSTGGPVSPALTVALENDTSADVERLLGWQLRLQIVPISGVGTLQFASGSEPSVGYVLEGNSGGLSAAPSGTNLFAFDEAEQLDGVEVPTAGATLLDLAFQTFDGALGEFLLVAVPGLANTQWSDGAFVDRGFANVPLVGIEPVALATVTIVPEPASALLWAIGAALVMRGLPARMRRRRLN